MNTFGDSSMSTSINKEFKTIFIDQIIFLAIGVGVMICLPLICGPIFTVLLELAVATSWGYLCRRVLLYPLDLLFGSNKCFAYFATHIGVVECEFRKRKCCPEWKFRLNNENIVLMVPILTTLNDINKIEYPPKDEKLEITYLRFSKILLSFKVVSDSEADDMPL